jgi:hypothetical protein
MFWNTTTSVFRNASVIYKYIPVASRTYRVVGFTSVVSHSTHTKVQ